MEPKFVVVEIKPLTDEYCSGCRYFHLVEDDRDMDFWDCDLFGALIPKCKTPENNYVKRHKLCLANEIK